MRVFVNGQLISLKEYIIEKYSKELNCEIVDLFVGFSTTRLTYLQDNETKTTLVLNNDYLTSEVKLWKQEMKS